MNTSDGMKKNKKKNRNQNKISSISKHNKIDIDRLSHQDQDIFLSSKSSSRRLGG